MKFKYIFVSVFCFISILVGFTQEKIIKIENKYPVTIIGEKEDDEVIFNEPNYVRFNKFDQNIYVVDRKDNKILIFDKELNFIDEFGRYGQGPGEFYHPYDITFDSEGNKLIIDKGNARIQIFNKDNKYVSGFNQIMYNYRPNIAVDSKRRIYLNLPENDSLFTVFDYNGNQLFKIGKILKSDNPAFQPFVSLVFYVIDENDNLYYTFHEKPVLIKYNSNHKQIFDINYDHLPEVLELIKIYEKNQRERTKNSNRFYGKVYCQGISLDKNYIYLILGTLNSYSIYLFDKNNGDIIRKDQYYIKEKHPCFVKDFSMDDENNVFIIDRKNYCLIKFKK